MDFSKNPLNFQPDALPNRNVNPAAVMTLLSKAVTQGSEPARKRGPRLSSFNAAVLDLDIGESTCKIRVVDSTTTVERLSAELPMIREQVRNSTTPAVTNAKAHHKGSKYSIEVADLMTPTGRLFVTAIVTREA